MALDGTKAYTYAAGGGSLDAIDLASGETFGSAEPEGALPDGYLPATRDPADTDVAPACEQRRPVVATVAGTKVALGLFPVVEKGSGTTPDSTAMELVALDTESGRTAWRDRLDIQENNVTCRIAGVSANTAVTYP
ncbi:hypothetical protein [Streptomyces sp. MZ04]|uniref:hypothetical protein n=1 Tax=Streptomyces sp. MZ04 TaxID=2559236 RepID=UPI00107EDF63|nr:hypothetical protein [Streptomyces sp. MZ04]TGA92606.1 hypothetical protein E2651_36670 [Streptomyces sp. MZ04]